MRRLAVVYGRGLKSRRPHRPAAHPAHRPRPARAAGRRRPHGLDPDGDRALLRNGPVHYGLTPLPGAGEPFAVAGHRTTYGAPFYKLDKLRAGDRIYVDTPYAQFRYAVAEDDHRRPDGRRRAARPRLRPGAHDLHAAVQRQPPPDRLGDARAGDAAEEGAAAADGRQPLALPRAQPAARPGNGGRSATLPSSIMTRSSVPDLAAGVLGRHEEQPVGAGHRAQDARALGAGGREADPAAVMR